MARVVLRRSADAVMVAPTRTRDSSPSVAARARVLVVEDERAIRDVLVEHLADEGYTVDAAATIAQALARIGAATPDLILLDLMLPGGSGWDFLRHRGIDPSLARIPTIVISAAPLDRLLQAKELGATACLTKPFDLDVLSGLVHSAVADRPRAP